MCARVKCTCKRMSVVGGRVVVVVNDDETESEGMELWRYDSFICIAGLR